MYSARQNQHKCLLSLQGQLPLVTLAVINEGPEAVAEVVPSGTVKFVLPPSGDPWCPNISQADLENRSSYPCVLIIALWDWVLNKPVVIINTIQVEIPSAGTRQGFLLTL